MFMLLPSSFMKSLGEKVHLALLVMSPKVCCYGTTSGNLLEGAQINAFIEIMKEFGIPSQLVKLVKMMLEEMNNKVKIQGKVSPGFEIFVRIRQGDALSSLTFNLCVCGEGYKE
jgi:hypothetical protein